MISLLAMVTLALLALLLLLLLVQILRRVAVGLLWWRERRRLQRGDREQRAIGAWTWVRLRRARYDAPLPVYASPDVAVAWARRAGDPDVLKVAEIVSKVAFDPHGSVSRVDGKVVWVAARAAGRRPSGASLRQRWRWSARTPRQARG